MADYLPRAASGALGRLVSAMPAVVVTGPRQIGKSSLVRNAPALAEHVVLDLDDSTIRRDALADPESFVRRYPRLIIDEVQRVPDLLLAVKAAVDADRHRQRGRFILTGSANLLAMDKSIDSLAGRAGYLRMAPMTRRELLGFGTAGEWDTLWSLPFDDWQQHFARNDAIPADWHELAVRGGYPVPAIQLYDEARAEWFASYVMTYLERDLRDVTAIESLGDFQRAMRAFALRAGTPVNHADVARELGLVARTLRRWLDVLVVTGQVTELPAYTAGRGARLRRRPKFYWNDPALAMNIATTPDPEGSHLETIVLNDLLVWSAGHSVRPSIMYWRDEADREVDFVIERPKGIIAVEVKSTTRPGSDDWRHLSRFVKDYDRQCIGAVLLHGGDETFRAADRVLAVPWWRVL